MQAHRQNGQQFVAPFAPSRLCYVALCAVMLFSLLSSRWHFGVYNQNPLEFRPATPSSCYVDGETNVFTVSYVRTRPPGEVDNPREDG